MDAETESSPLYKNLLFGMSSKAVIRELMYLHLPDDGVYDLALS